MTKLHHLLCLFYFFHHSNSACDKSIREKYCDPADTACLKCQVGPTCPAPGPRAALAEDGTLLLRGVEPEVRSPLLTLLDEKRSSESFSACAPLFQWEDSLAEAAQAWADMCALVEYQEGGGGNKRPRRLHHDRSSRRAVLAEGRFPTDRVGLGVAQTVHWARTVERDLTGKVMQELVNSKLRIEEGLIDGLFTHSDGEKLEENAISRGQATHVGCGWIQFPSSFAGNHSGEFENFLVCNYGIGTASKTSCSKAEKEEEAQTNATSFVTYYSAPSEVIEDVKKCLNAVRCNRKRQLDLSRGQLDFNRGRPELKKEHQDASRRQVDLNRGQLDSNRGQFDLTRGHFDLSRGHLDLNRSRRSSLSSCSGEVESCLQAKSGLRFLQPNQLSSKESSARSSDGYPTTLDVEASKCKIDTILCGLNGSHVCRDIIRRCLPLLDLIGDDPRPRMEEDKDRSVVECECADLVLADGTRGDCSQEDEEGRRFCYVRRSPCVAVGGDGRVEMSGEEERLDGLVHVSYKMCENTLV